MDNLAHASDINGAIIDTNPITTNWFNDLNKLANDLKIGLKKINSIENEQVREAVQEQIERFLKIIDNYPVVILADTVSGLKYSNPALYAELTRLKSMIFEIIGQPNVAFLHGEFIGQLRSFLNGIDKAKEKIPSAIVN